MLFKFEKSNKPDTHGVTTIKNGANFNIFIQLPICNIPANT